ncbi:gamma-aminobutyric acid receptor subunit beta isoform X2 [Eurytemora carolleeae]|nr:gamma-aminobutyric acid receptor subunit beta isoform X2 [Eurytemora carolleeae]|eukprot:XP_023340726.1 gamma-aminobutyric acid receptor subunit beta-like isoform X2 [Eurytemora affinis]
MLNVNISLAILSILSIDEVKNSFNIKFQLRSEWKDPRLSYQNLKSKADLNVVSPLQQHYIWVPQMIFFNTEDNLETLVDTKTITQIYPHQDFRFDRAPISSSKNTYIFAGSENTLSLTRTYNVNLLCNYDMMFFPFDSQICFVEIITKGNTDQFLNLVPDELEFRGPQELSQYFIRGFQQCSSTISGKNGLRIEVVLGRRLLGNALTIFLPTMLLLVIGHVTNFFKPFFFEAVISVNLTVMLVLATMFMSVSASLPNTSYVKMVDIWMLFNMFLPFIEVLLHTYIDLLREEEGEEREINHHGKPRKVAPSVSTLKVGEGQAGWMNKLVSRDEQVQQNALKEYYKGQKNVNKGKLAIAKSISLRWNPAIIVVFILFYWSFGLTLYFYPKEIGAVELTCT